jgi:hypothetical protein
MTEDVSQMGRLAAAEGLITKMKAAASRPQDNALFYMATWGK